MSKFNLHGEEYEVFDGETPAIVRPGELISSPARTLLLQTPDRKFAYVVHVGVGGEAYGLPVKATRLDDDLSEHLVAHLRAVEEKKAAK